MSEHPTLKMAKRVTRVALRSDTEVILEGWRNHLKGVFPSFSPSYADLVTWAVERSATLTSRNIQEIRRRFCDEVKELECLVARLKKAKVSGDENVVRELLSTVSKRKTSRKKPVATPAIETDLVTVT